MANTYDGYNTTFTMAADASLKFVPKSITPPGTSVGTIQVTPLNATAWRTTVPTTLKTLGDMSVEAFFDVDVYADLISYTGTNTLFTITWSDASTLAFYGFIGNASFTAHTEGEAPMINLTITPTNRHSLLGAETAPATA